MFGIGKKKKKKEEDKEKNGKQQNGQTETIREITSHSTTSSYIETRQITTKSTRTSTVTLSDNLNQLRLEGPINSKLPSIFDKRPSLDIPFNTEKRSSVPALSTYTSIYNRDASNSTDALPFKQPSTPFSVKPYRSVYTREPFATYSASTSRLTPSSIRTSNTSLRSPSLIQKSASLTNVPPPTPSSSKSVILPNPARVDKKLKVKVVRCTKPCDQGEQKVPTYKTSPKNKARVLVISNVKFLNEKQYRQGAEIDEKNVVDLFMQMGMKIVKHRDKKKVEMEKIITNYTNDSSLKQVDINIVVIMSHGTGMERHDSTEVVGIDDHLLPTTWILEQFSNEKCPFLCNKPKIFIFQCCRGSNQDIGKSIQHDAVPFLPRKYADMLIAYSTVPGFVSHRDPQTGTWYIQTICEVFMTHAHDTDVESMLKIVDQKLENITHNYSRQTTSFENRGFKTCYLHPGL